MGKSQKENENKLKNILASHVGLDDSLTRKINAASETNQIFQRNFLPISFSSLSHTRKASKNGIGMDIKRKRSERKRKKENEKKKIYL